MRSGLDLIIRMVAMLLTLIWATSVFAQSSPTLNTYLPQVQQLQQAGRWQDLEPLARQAMAQLQARSGSDSPDVIQASGWLAMALKGQGRAAEAEAVVRHALQISVKTSGPNSLQTASIESGLANTLELEQRYSDAEPLMRHALQSTEAALGPDHLEVAYGLRRLA
jgi:hypothetical protein